MSLEEHNAYGDKEEKTMFGRTSEYKTKEIPHKHNVREKATRRHVWQLQGDANGSQDMSKSQTTVRQRRCRWQPR